VVRLGVGLVLTFCLIASVARSVSNYREERVGSTVSQRRVGLLRPPAVTICALSFDAGNDLEILSATHSNDSDITVEDILDVDESIAKWSRIWLDNQLCHVLTTTLRGIGKLQLVNIMVDVTNVASLVTIALSDPDLALSSGVQDLRSRVSVSVNGVKKGLRKHHSVVYETSVEHKLATKKFPCESSNEWKEVYERCQS